MNGKFVWADGELIYTTQARWDIHHVHLMQELMDSGRLRDYPQNWIGGTWSEDPFHDGIVHGNVDWSEGTHPSLEEILEQIKEKVDSGEPDSFPLPPPKRKKGKD
jgi:hypothetical protein